MSGSAKRIKDLQAIFDSPEKYGKGLDWTGYTVHDAANVLRRYLNQLPEPIIPLDFYNRFRNPLTVQPETFCVEEAIIVYQRLISELPPLNRQLLLYILDLLAVFASKAEQNRMNAENLAAIFQPGLISHPSHEMAPLAYRLSQDVLVFLINHQDHFLLGMRGSNDGEGGPEMPMSMAGPGVARSPSSSSIGADDVRKFGSLRRNASVSSKKSAVHASPRSGGVSRSNTLPTKRSPRPRPMVNFRPVDRPGSPRPGGGSAPSSPLPIRASSPRGSHMLENTSPVEPPRSEGHGGLVRQPRSRQVSGSSHSRQYSDSAAQRSPPSKERSFVNRFSLGPDTDKPQRKLQKKRTPGSSNHSAESSSVSLPPSQSPIFDHPLATSLPLPPLLPKTTIQIPTPGSVSTGYSATTAATSLMPTMSPTPSSTSSVTSQDSTHSYSDATNASTTAEKRKKARSRWRWSNSKVDEWQPQSPTFASSTGSIAEVMRRTSRSPPAEDRRKLSSEFSGDDEYNPKSVKASLSWLRRRGASPDRDMQVQLPQPQVQLSQPQVQPPTPSSLASLASTPISEVGRKLEETTLPEVNAVEPAAERHRMTDWTRANSSTPTLLPARQDASPRESPDTTPKPSPEETTPNASPEITPKASPEASPEALPEASPKASPSDNTLKASPSDNTPKATPSDTTLKTSDVTVEPDRRNFPPSLEIRKPPSQAGFRSDSPVRVLPHSLEIGRHPSVNHTETSPTAASALPPSLEIRKPAQAATNFSPLPPSPQALALPNGMVKGVIPPGTAR